MWRIWLLFDAKRLTGSERYLPLHAGRAHPLHSCCLRIASIGSKEPSASVTDRSDRSGRKLCLG